MISPQLTVQCHRKETAAPCKMKRGSATTDDEYSYFIPRDSDSVYRYHWSTEKWEELTPCPYKNSALVIINRHVTTVGGSYTNTLFTLQEKEWVAEYRPMKTVRYSAAAICTSNSEYVAVVGGCDVSNNWTTTVELFQVSSNTWHQLADLPQHTRRPSATVCANNLLHVIGERGDAYFCSLKLLLCHNGPILPQLIPHLMSWTPLPRPQYGHLTAATLSGQLVVVGGWRFWGGAINTIYQLLGEEWVEVGSMSRGRWQSLIVTPSQDKMMIVGGDDDSVDICTLV